MVEVNKLEMSHRYTYNSNHEENKQPVRSLQSDIVITATTNAKKSWEQDVCREQKYMQQNETKERGAYCTYVNCYCRRQKQQETVGKKAIDDNEVMRCMKKTLINERINMHE